MNNEILRILAPKEYITAFLNNNIRLDKRGLKDSRSFSYVPGALDSFQLSCTSMIGPGNKLIGVLKSENSSINTFAVSVQYLGDQQQVVTKKKYPDEANIAVFINKLISDNIDFLDEMSDIKCASTLHIVIVNCDGNIFDCITSFLVQFFENKDGNGGNKLSKKISFKRVFTSKTFCVIDDKLLLDPSQEEVEMSSYYFSLIKFSNEEFLIHKIKGDLINVKLIEEAFQA